MEMTGSALSGVSAGVKVAPAAIDNIAASAANRMIPRIVPPPASTHYAKRLAVRKGSGENDGKPIS
jgi:hypothetical protein